MFNIHLDFCIGLVNNCLNPLNFYYLIPIQQQIIEPFDNVSRYERTAQKI